MPFLDRLFPDQANNDYRGSRISLYAFCALSLIITFRSLVHFLAPDSGVQSIATLVLFSGNPDPNRVVYMFSSLWGSQQFIVVLIYAVVLWRYRNLIPLMYLLLFIELLFRLTVGFLHPLTEEYYARTPPGKIMNLPVLVLVSGLLVASLRNPPASTSRA